MPTLLERLDRLMGRPQPEGKAGFGGTGPGVVGLTFDVPISYMSDNPQKKAKAAMAAYREHFWVGVAERAVSGSASGVGWHLENSDGQTIDETSPQPEQDVLALMERPASKMRLRRRELWSLTLRHMGLVGYTFWYLDQQELLAGTPTGVYYIRPDRMLPALDKQGELLGWVMDGDRPNGRQPVGFTPDEIVVFRLDPSDDGYLGIGLVEQAWRKISLAQATDRHSEKMIASGGRLAGLITPTPEKGSFSADEYKAIVNELRAVTDSEDAAKKALIFKVPVDYKPTSATPSQMNLPELMRGSRDDILAGWNVPLSQVGIATAAGLNSGDKQKYEEAAVWQGAREPRLTSFRETLQFEMLDRFQQLGVEVELKLHTPTFDDQMPLYDLAAKGADLPLSNNQRRALVGAPPIPPEILGTSGLPLGDEIWIPSTYVLIGTDAPDSETDDTMGKARLTPKGLRVKTAVTWEPRLRRKIAELLNTQRSEVAAKVRAKHAHLQNRPKDSSVYWNDKTERARLEALLGDAEAELARDVAGKVGSLVKVPGKASPFSDRLLARVRAKTAARVVGISDTTREGLQELVAKGISEGLSASELASLIEDATLFNEARAEVISRTETALAYNEAAIGSYEEMGVAEVEAVDGDNDEECAQRDGQVFSVEEAAGIEDHPNGTLDWIPVI